ncbi:MAG: class A beta-lactamase-related serine hydrolase, partial [Chitinophagaceae bacterium]
MLNCTRIPKITVIHKGKTVVDLFGGWANKETGAPWQHDTLTNVYSCTKAIANICVLHLISHSDLTYQTKINVPLPRAYFTEKKGNAQIINNDKVLFCLTEPQSILITDLNGKFLWRVKLEGDPY